jgi:hypothetical protein
VLLGYLYYCRRFDRGEDVLYIIIRALVMLMLLFLSGRVVVIGRSILY